MHTATIPVQSTAASMSEEIVEIGNHLANFDMPEGVMACRIENPDCESCQ